MKHRHAAKMWAWTILCQWIEKLLYHIPQRQNKCPKYPVLSEALETHDEVQLGGERPSWPVLFVELTICALPSPHLHVLPVCLTLRKSKLNLSIDYHYANFLTMPLGFIKLFSNSPLSVLSRLSRGPAFRLTIMKSVWSVWTRVWWSCFGHFWPPFSRSSLSPDCSENHLFWVDSIRTVPLGLQ